MPQFRQRLLHGFAACRDEFAAFGELAQGDAVQGGANDDIGFADAVHADGCHRQVIGAQD